MINLQNLLDDAKCYETVRRLRWPVGVRCPHCDAPLTEGAGSRRTIQVPVFGTTQSGKTRFMLSAAVALEQQLTGSKAEAAALAPATSTVSE